MALQQCASFARPSVSSSHPFIVESASIMEFAQKAAAPSVWMYIAKFDREVLIEPDHPLAVAQREANASTVRRSGALGVALVAGGSGEPGQSGDHPAEPSAPHTEPHTEPHQNRSARRRARRAQDAQPPSRAGAAGAAGAAGEAA